MDCEKFEETMIAELYDELDELTSAAAKRHVAGCARCAALIGGLRATRRVATVPLVEPPQDLELRILAAARNVQNVVPLKRRIGRAISWAGSWAMRPQTAMAAVFLVMVGSSLVFLRASRSKQDLAVAPVTVMERGSPAPAASMASGTKGGDLPLAAPVAQTPQAFSEPVATATATAMASAAPMDGYATRHATPAFGKDESAAANLNDQADKELESIVNAGPVAGVPALPPAARPKSAAAPAATGAMLDADGRSSPYQDSLSQGGPGQAQTVSPTFTRARAAFEAGRYDEATRLFDGLSANDVNAQYQAAKAMQRGHGCSMAVAQRYDAVAARAGQMTMGWDATFDAGLCYAAINRNDLASQRFNGLLQVPTHAGRAQAQLNALTQVAARKAAAQQQAPAAAAPPPPASPPPAKASDAMGKAH